MRSFALISLMATAAALSGCVTYPDPPPAAVVGPCGTYGYVDMDNDGLVESHEWTAYRAGAFPAWDADRDGRIERDEFMRCWRAGGFVRTGHDPDAWSHYWAAFDANGDGWLTGDEYWSAAAWARLDRNRNGILDSAEWRWW